jgi:hypothetical protein
MAVSWPADSGWTKRVRERKTVTMTVAGGVGFTDGGDRSAGFGAVGARGGGAALGGGTGGDYGLCGRVFSAG